MKKNKDINNEIILAMWKFLDSKDLSIEKLIYSWRNAEEWEAVLGINISARRLSVMYRKGLLKRFRSLEKYRDVKYHYFPCFKTQPKVLNDFE